MDRRDLGCIEDGNDIGTLTASQKKEGVFATLWEERVGPNRTKIRLRTPEEFMFLLRIMDVTNQWKRELQAESRAAMLVAGIYIKKKRNDDEGGTEGER